MSIVTDLAENGNPRIVVGGVDTHADVHVRVRRSEQMRQRATRNTRSELEGGTRPPQQRSTTVNEVEPTCYSFEAEVWEYDGQGTWHFVSLPEDVTDEIDERFRHRAKGFGSQRVEVTIGSTTWRTSIFPDTKRETFILPVKKAVRKAEHLVDGSVTRVGLEVVLD